MTPERSLSLMRLGLGVLFLVRTTIGARLVGLASQHWLYGWSSGAWHPSSLGVELPSAVVCTLCVLRTLGAVAFLIGYRVRLSGLVAALCGLLVLTQDPLAFFNTMYLLHVGVVMVALSIPNALSPPRFLVMSVYAWAGIAKLNSDWLSGRVLFDLVANGTIRHGGSWLGPTTSVVASVVVVVVELSLPLLLWLRRSRSIALVAAVAFHVALEAVVRPDLFGWAMLALLIAFVGEQKPRMLSR